MSMLRQLMRSQRRSLARSISLAARAKQLAAPRGFRGPRNLSAPHAHPPDRSWPGRTPAKRLFSESSKQNSKKQSSSSVSGGSDKGTAKDSTAAAATPAGSSKMSSSQSKKVPHVHTHSGPADLSVLAYLENAGLKISPEVGMCLKPPLAVHTALCALPPLQLFMRTIVCSGSKNMFVHLNNLCASVEWLGGRERTKARDPSHKERQQ